MIDLAKQPRRRLFDRLYLEFEGQTNVLEFPLCEIIDGRIEEITPTEVSMRELNGKITKYETPSFVTTIDKSLNENKKVVALWLQQEGSKVRERIL